MKNISKLVIAFLIFTIQLSNVSNAQIAINEDGSSPDASAMLEVSSSSKGILIPRLTEAERDEIANPVQGLLIYNTDDDCFNYYTGTAWYKDCGRTLTADATTLEAQNIGGTDNEKGQSISIDTEGNIVISGSFEGTFTIGDSTFTSAGGRDAFLAKFDSDYNVLWSKQIGNANNESYNRSTVDNDNNIYVAIEFSGTIDIERTTLTAAGTNDIVIVKYNKYSVFQWAIQTGCDNNMSLETIRADENDNVYIVGDFIGNVTLGASSLSSSITDSYLAKLEGNGTWKWAVQTNATNRTYPFDIAVKGNSVYFGGEMNGGTTTIGNTTFTSSGAGSGFLAKYDTTGTFQWAKEIISTDDADVYGITIDNNDDVVITGFFNQDATIDTSTFNVTNKGMFLAKYSSVGNFYWASIIESSNSIEGWKVASNDKNELFVFGPYYGSLTFNSTTFTSNGSQDLFLTKYDTNGNPIWIATGGGSANDYGLELSIANDGNIHLVGYFQGTTTFGSQTLTSNGGTDILLLQYNSDDGSQNNYTNNLSDSQDGDTDASNEIQDISFSGTTLSISNGSSVDLSSINTDTDTDTDDQTIDQLSLDGNILEISLEDDGEVLQTLDLSGLTFDEPNTIIDADGDTKIQVEESSNEDIIRFDLGGTEHFTFQEGRIEFLNSGTTIALGDGAGENDDFDIKSRNVFVGYEAGNTNTSGSNNIAIGMQALFTNNEDDNTAIGYQALYNNTTGSGNLALGTGAGLFNQQGSENVFIGVDAGLGSSLHDKSNNVMIGFGAGASNEGDGNVFLGYYAGENESGSNRLYIANSNTSSPLIFGEFDNNEVIINGKSSNNSNSRTLFVNGSIGATSAFNNDSDRRLKTNIATIPNALDKVLQMRGVTYQWKDGRETGDRMGFIAQEVEPILPQVVDNENDHYTMQYAPITAVLIEAVKEQQAEIEALKNLSRNLVDENKALKKQQAQINELKSMLLKMQAQLETVNNQSTSAK